MSSLPDEDIVLFYEPAGDKQIILRYDDKNGRLTSHLVNCPNGIRDFTWDEIQKLSFVRIRLLESPLSEYFWYDFTIKFCNGFNFDMETLRGIKEAGKVKYESLRLGTSTYNVNFNFDISDLKSTYLSPGDGEWLEDGRAIRIELSRNSDGTTAFIDDCIYFETTTNHGVIFDDESKIKDVFFVYFSNDTKRGLGLFLDRTSPTELFIKSRLVGCPNGIKDFTRDELLQFPDLVRVYWKSISRTWIDLSAAGSNWIYPSIFAGNGDGDINIDCKLDLISNIDPSFSFLLSFDSLMEEDKYNIIRGMWDNRTGLGLFKLVLTDNISSLAKCKILYESSRWTPNSFEYTFTHKEYIWKSPETGKAIELAVEYSDDNKSITITANLSSYFVQGMEYNLDDFNLDDLVLLTNNFSLTIQPENLDNITYELSYHPYLNTDEIKTVNGPLIASDNVFYLTQLDGSQPDDMRDVIVSFDLTPLKNMTQEQYNDNKRKWYVLGDMFTFHWLPYQPNSFNTLYDDTFFDFKVKMDGVEQTLIPFGGEHLYRIAYLADNKPLCVHREGHSFRSLLGENILQNDGLGGFTLDEIKSFPSSLEFSWKSRDGAASSTKSSSYPYLDNNNKEEIGGLIQRSLHKGSSDVLLTLALGTISGMKSK